MERLGAMLHAYATVVHRRDEQGTELGALLHRGEHVTRAQQQLVDLVEDVLREVAAAGALRDDVSPHELAAFCVHALGAAGRLRSEAAVRRLVSVTMAGLLVHRTSS